MKRTAFFISDGTGITAETLGRSLLAQFGNIEFEKLTRPYIDTTEKAETLVWQIQQAAAEDGAAPIIFDTVINTEIRDVLRRSGGFMVDIFSTFLAPLEQALGAHSSYSVGKSHAVAQGNYMRRIEAVNFALENDDGARYKQYGEADVILIGVSRCGKTPTCLYMAMQYGILAANYPITEEDMEQLRLPKVLGEFRDKLFGLTIDPGRLSDIRQERRPNSRYAELDQCEFEVREVENLLRRESIPFLDTTRCSVEEICTRILVEKGVERHLE